MLPWLHFIQVMPLRELRQIWIVFRFYIRILIIIVVFVITTGTNHACTWSFPKMI